MKSDYERINQYVKEFLRFNKYQSTLECFEAEERTKLVTSKNKLMNIHPDVCNTLTTADLGPVALGDIPPTLQILRLGPLNSRQREEHRREGHTGAA
jgi:hypothetical protein